MYVGDINEQIRVFLYSVGFGLIIGFFYDLIRIARLAVNKKTGFVFLQDILFFVVAAPCTFCFLLVVNYGRFRFYVFCALLIGFICYYFTVSRFFLLLVSKFYGRIKAAIILISRIITAPVRLLFKPIGKIWLIMNGKFKKFSKSVKNKPKSS